MAVRIDGVQGVQEIEYAVSGPGAVTRVITLAGTVPINWTGGGGSGATERFLVSLGPVLSNTEFVRGIASAWITAFSFSVGDPSVVGSASSGLSGVSSSWRIAEVDASHDDDTGRVRLAFELNASASPGNAQVSAVSFQVTVLAAI